MAEKARKKTVMIFGTFDGIHPGHLSLISQARLLGDRLIVVVAREQTVERIKSRKPRRSEAQRVQDLRDLKIINRVELGQKRNRYGVIEKFKPDVIGLGYDQVAFIDGLAKAFPKIKIVRLKPFFPEKYKSSKLAK